MEQETILKEIFNSLNEHSKQLNEKIDEKFEQHEDRFTRLENKMDDGFSEVNHKIDNLSKKVDGLRIDLQETQETSEFAASKVIQHEKKLPQISVQ